jgi:hypothetical protein
MKTKILFLICVLVLMVACNKTNTISTISKTPNFEGTYKMYTWEGWQKNHYAYIKKNKGDDYTISYHTDMGIEPEYVKSKGDTLFYKIGEYTTTTWIYILNKTKDTIDVKLDDSGTNNFKHKAYYIKQ